MKKHRLPGICYIQQHTKLVRGFGNADTAASRTEYVERLARCDEGMLEGEN